MDLTNKRVLVFGDSLTHRGSNDAPNGRDVTEGITRSSSSPGDLLASYLVVKNGAAAARINGKVSRSAYNFWRIEDAEAILKEEAAWNPNVVFVFLGTNDLGLNTSKDKEAFVKLHDALGINGADLWAIGPPAFADQTDTDRSPAVYRTLKSVFGSDHVIDLRDLTQDLKTVGRTSDGVHFTVSGAKTAASRLSKQIAKTTESTPAVAKIEGHPVAIGLGIGLVLGLLVLRRRATS
jgi:lysophospholipase L1-like esterase